MAQIKVLPKEISELIAAGEVVERPASVIKELVENSIDSGATKIVVEISHGGITYMRVTDNGCGIAEDQVRTAFLRHATSKIKSASDLDSILTLGFRGEALASIAAVAKVELLTSTGLGFGTGYAINGSEEVSFEEIGCPKGTTIIIRDLFYNVPARMKFLKKDVSEANTVAAVMDRMSLSHPEVSFKLIRDGKTVLTTSGDGKLKSAVYSVLGREFCSSLTEVNYNEGNITINGFTCFPSRCRANRNGQFFFLNGRYIKSGTMAAAMDQAYKNSAMVGRFPACVLNLSVPAGTVDVNVHPTKTEVRFSDEKSIFEITYRGVRQALASGDKRPELNIDQKRKPLNLFETPQKFEQMHSEQSVKAPSPEKSSNNVLYSPQISGEKTSYEKTNLLKSSIPTAFLNNNSIQDPYYKKAVPAAARPVSNRILDIDVDESEIGGSNVTSSQNPENAAQNSKAVTPQVRENTSESNENSTDIDLSKFSYVGEAFSTYIIVSVGDKLYFIDKHAAHERMNFENLKKNLKTESQLLIMPVSIGLLKEEYDAVLNNLDLLGQCGFEVEDFGDSTVIVRAVPAILDGCDVSKLISEVAGNLLKNNGAISEKTDDILHSIACKSAIKAGYNTSKDEQIYLAEQVLSRRDLMYCPHGRPIAFEMKKSQLEKQFGRIV